MSLSEKTGMAHNACTVPNKRGNAYAERKIKDIQVSMLATLLYNEQHESKALDYLQGALFAIRTNVPSGWEFSPAQLQFGHQPQFPAESQASQNYSFVTPPTPDMKKHIKFYKTRIHKLNQMRIMAKDLSLEIRRSVNEKKTFPKLEPIGVGALVWFLPESKGRDGDLSTRKMHSDWIGPYTVVEKYPGKYQETKYRIRHIHTSNDDLGFSVIRRYIVLVGKEDFIAENKLKLQKIQQNNTKILNSVLPTPSQQHNQNITPTSRKIYKKNKTTR